MRPAELNFRNVTWERGNQLLTMEGVLECRWQRPPSLPAVTLAIIYIYDEVSGVLAEESMDFQRKEFSFRFRVPAPQDMEGISLLAVIRETHQAVRYELAPLKQSPHSGTGLLTIQHEYRPPSDLSPLEELATVAEGDGFREPLWRSAGDQAEFFWIMASSLFKKKRRSLGLAFGGAALVAATAGFYVGKPVYDVGMKQARWVMHYARTLPMKPLLHEEKGRLVSYLPTKDFVEDSARVWDMKPVPVEAVQEGGSLYLARQALSFGSDPWLERHWGFHPKRAWDFLMWEGQQGSVGFHGQVCDSVIAAAGERGIGSWSPKWWSSLACGFGLGWGGRATLDETIAMHFTFHDYGGDTLGVMNFLDRAYGIYHLDDPRLKSVHQILIAALAEQPYVLSSRYPTEEALWEATVQRAQGILDDMYREGEISAGEYLVISTEFPAVGVQPKLLEGVPLYYDLDGPPEFAPVQAMVEEELETRCAYHRGRCSTWVRDNEHFYTEVDPNLQRRIHQAFDRYVTFSRYTTGSSLVVNGEGEVLAFHSEPAESSRVLVSVAAQPLHDLYAEVPSRALVNMAAGVELASLGRLPQETSFGPWSVWSAPSPRELRRLDREVMAEVLNCYGDLEGLRYSPENEEIRGDWMLSSADMAAFLKGVLSGEALVKPHVLTGERTAGEDVWYDFDTSRSQDECATLAYQDGGARLWLEGAFKREFPAMNKPDEAVHFVGGVETLMVAVHPSEDAQRRTENVVWAPIAFQDEAGEDLIVVTRFHVDMPENTGTTVHPDRESDLFRSLLFVLFKMKQVAPVNHEILRMVSPPKPE